jgi:hypothetical protein
LLLQILVMKFSITVPPVAHTAGEMTLIITMIDQLDGTDSIKYYLQSTLIVGGRQLSCSSPVGWCRSYYECVVLQMCERMGGARLQ